MNLRRILRPAMGRLMILAAVLSPPGAVLAQSSFSHRLNEHSLDAGGRPLGAVVTSSPGFRVSLDSIGEMASRRGLSAASHRMDGGSGQACPPPARSAT